MSEINEKCKWKLHGIWGYDSRELHKYFTGCQEDILTKLCGEKFKYCPRCGKEIEEGKND
jgi:hypothetical protein